MCSYRGLINLPHVFVSLISLKGIHSNVTLLKQGFDLKAMYANSFQVFSSKNMLPKEYLCFEMFFFSCNKSIFHFFSVLFEFCLNK